MFISCGAINLLTTVVITEFNNDKNVLYYNSKRLNRLIKFVRYNIPKLNKVKVKQNKLIWMIKLFKNRIKLKFNSSMI